MKNSIIIFLLVTLMLFSFWLVPVISWGNDETLSVEVAKTLIVEKNAEALDLLKYDGYTIISSNVNFNKAGEYEVNYLSNDDEIISKKVIVVDHNQEYYEEHQNRYQSTDKRYFDCLATCQIDENRYAYVYAVKHRNSSSDINDYFIDVYDCGTLIVSSIIFYNVMADILALVNDGNYIIGVGWYRNLFGIIQAFLFRVSIETRRVERFYYGDDGTSCAENIFITNDAYYLVGSTTSEQDPFLDKRSDSDSFILKVDKENLNVKKTIMAGIKGNDKITNLIIDKNYIYLIQKYSLGYEKSRLIKMDLFGNITKILELVHPYKLDVKKFVQSKNEKYLIMSSFQYDMQGMSDVLYKINEDLTLIPVFENNDLTWELKDILINEDDIINCLYHKKNTKTGYKIQVFKLGLETTYFEYFSYNSNIIPYGWAGNQVIIGIDNNTQDLVKIEYDYLKVINHPNHIIMGKDNPQHDYQVMINNRFVNHSETKSKYDYDLNVFGIYPGRYVFNTDKLTFVYKIDWDVWPLISIRNGETYDTNLKLEFNGSGLLNNKPIESGIIITEIGDYLLQIVGKDDSRKIYHFKVTNIASPVEEKNSIFSSYSSKIEKKDPIQLKPLPTINFIPHVEEPSKLSGINSNQWLYLIPVCATLAGVIVLVKMKP